MARTGTGTAAPGTAAVTTEAETLAAVPGLSLRRGGPALRAGRPWACPLRVSARVWWPRLLTAPLRALPDFVIIGAQRGGTTSLFEHLAGHPGVRASLKKEVHFLDENWATGPAWYRAHFPLKTALRRSGCVTGEGSPNYLFDPEAPARAATLLPGARFLAVLRHPVDRALSHHGMNARKGLDTLPFAEAVAAEPERLARAAHLPPYERRILVRRASYLARGEYAAQLERWREAVGPERLLVLQSEQFLRDPRGVMERVQAFLGLPVHHPPEYRRYHDSGGARMDPGLRGRLLAHFAPHNERLFALLGQRWDWDE